MLADILLWWIGLQLNAPTWYFVVIGFLLLCQVINFGITMYKKGASA